MIKCTDAKRAEVHGTECTTGTKTYRKYMKKRKGRATSRREREGRGHGRRAQNNHKHVNKRITRVTGIRQQIIQNDNNRAWGEKPVMLACVCVCNRPAHVLLYTRLSFKVPKVNLISRWSC